MSLPLNTLVALDVAVVVTDVLSLVVAELVGVDVLGAVDTDVVADDVAVEVTLVVGVVISHPA